jgi:hypothetical protein
MRPVGSYIDAHRRVSILLRAGGDDRANGPGRPTLFSDDLSQVRGRYPNLKGDGIYVGPNRNDYVRGFVD